MKFFISSSLGLLPLAAVAVRYAFAVGALVVTVDKDFWFVAAALRTDWTVAFCRSVEPCFKYFHHLNQYLKDA
jgi:hypothetical protein